MIDFTPLRDGEMTMAALSAGLGVDDLAQLTNQMVDNMLALIANCSDEDVVFIPEDPEAYDKYADSDEEVGMSWTLGHVIVHVTASAEEDAYLAVELARGVKPKRGRSRYETPWETVTTIAQCRERLEESRRMRLASLGMWPDEPFLENAGKYWGPGPINANGRFLLGLLHDDDHLGQIANIVAQGAARREAL